MLHIVNMYRISYNVDVTYSKYIYMMSYNVDVTYSKYIQDIT